MLYFHGKTIKKYKSNKCNINIVKTCMTIVEIPGGVATLQEDKAELWLAEFPELVTMAVAGVFWTCRLRGAGLVQWEESSTDAEDLVSLSGVLSISESVSISSSLPSSSESESKLLSESAGEKTIWECLLMYECEKYTYFVAYDFLLV